MQIVEEKVIITQNRKNYETLKIKAQHNMYFFYAA